MVCVVWYMVVKGTWISARLLLCCFSVSTLILHAVNKSNKSDFSRSLIGVKNKRTCACGIVEAHAAPVLGFEFKLAPPLNDHEPSWVWWMTGPQHLQQRSVFARLLQLFRHFEPSLRAVKA